MTDEMNEEEKDELRAQRKAIADPCLAKQDNWGKLPDKEQYEYETVQIVPGAIVWESDLNRLGEQGYRLVAVAPLTQVVHSGLEGLPEYINSGTSLIFERRKENE